MNDCNNLSHHVVNQVNCITVMPTGSKHGLKHSLWSKSSFTFQVSNKHGKHKHRTLLIRVTQRQKREDKNSHDRASKLCEQTLTLPQIQTTLGSKVKSYLLRMLKLYQSTKNSCTIKDKQVISELRHAECNSLLHSKLFRKFCS